MPKLILASASPQRKKLLKQLGISFKIHPSRTKELTQIKTTCAALVKDNALLKARDIASKYKEAIVIGSDTLVYGGNRELIGKPRNLKDARRILRILCTKPAWVYTGVAVIDTKSGRTIVGCEKTKVFMNKLSEKEIRSYHSKISPLDKAGGFDIEGWGAIFIRRIEGCYFNVVGLPLARLAQMLKKFGVSILCLILMATTYGCTTEYNLATRQEETFLYNTDREVSIGHAVSQKFDQEFTINTSVEENERIERILDKIIEVCDRKDIVYFIKLVEKEDLNAISLPGGYIYIFKGILDNADNDDQLAGVIAHEVGHITARHGIKRLQASYGAMVLQILASSQGGRMGAGVNIALSSLFSEHSQADEFEADRLGIKYMRAAGYDPDEMIKFLEKLKTKHEKAPIRKFSYWRTHPHIAGRIATVRQEITGHMEFRDYLNLLEGEQ